MHRAVGPSVLPQPVRVVLSTAVADSPGHAGAQSTATFIADSELSLSETRFTTQDLAAIHGSISVRCLVLLSVCTLRGSGTSVPVTRSDC